MNFFKDININRNEDKLYLFILLIFGILLSINLIHFNQLRGAFNSDIYIYLINSLNYAGMNYNNLSDPIWMSNGPVICFLTSLFFRLGYVDINAIFIVTGVFSILSILGMYAFLKVRFSPILSFTGAILYSSFSITLHWFSNGMLDVPAVALILWTLVFTVAAVERNPKYFILVSISFVITFYIRYTSTYILLIIALYMIKKFDVIGLLDNLISDRDCFKKQIGIFFKSDDFKWIFISLILGIILMLLGFCVLYYYGADFVFLSQASSSVSGISQDVGNPNFVPDRWFYFSNFINYISTNHIIFNDRLVEFFVEPSLFAYLVFSILIVGILLKCVNLIKNFNGIKKVFLNGDSYKTRYFSIFLCIMIIILLIISRYGYKYNYLIALLGLFIIFSIILSFSRKYLKDNSFFAFSIMNLALFSVFMLVFSYMNLKCIRYILPAIPAFAYFVIWGLDYILHIIDNGFTLRYSLTDVNCIRYDSKKLVSKIIPIILIIICLIVIFNYTGTVEIADKGNDIVNVCEFIIDYDPDYQSKEIASYMDRYIEWYLNKKIVFYGDTPLDKLNSTYMIRPDKLDDNSYYQEIYKSGDIRVYEKIS